MLAGYPVVGLKATLLDGSYHPVDSSEMAFIMAAKLAYKAAMPEAGPVILEPIPCGWIRGRRCGVLPARSPRRTCS